jgi:hypothetical protein
VKRKLLAILGILSISLASFETAEAKMPSDFSKDWLVSGEYFSKPVVDGRLMLTTTRDQIIAFNKHTGKKQWSFALGDLGAEAKLKIFDHYVFVYGVGDDLYVLDSATGKPLWKFTSDNLMSDANKNITTEPIFYKNLAVITTFSGEVYGLELNTGNIKWKFNSKSSSARFMVLSNPVILDHMIYFMSDFSAQLYAVNAKNGKFLWKLDLGEHDSTTLPQMFVYNKNLFLIYKEGKVISIDPRDSKIRYVKKSFRPFTGAAVLNGSKLFAIDEGQRKLLNLSLVDSKLTSRSYNKDIVDFSIDANRLAVLFQNELRVVNQSNEQTKSLSIQGSQVQLDGNFVYILTDKQILKFQIL